MNYPHFHAPLLQAAHAAPLLNLLAQATLPDAIESAVGYGRWWLDSAPLQLILSPGAARFMGVNPGAHPVWVKSLAHVIQEDRRIVVMAIREAAATSMPIHCEFRVRQGDRGVRWLRMQSVPQAEAATGLQSGVLIDITPSRQVDMRERFSYACTQILAGADALADAVPKIIQLVCQSLGWEWGAYWSMQSMPRLGPKLVCQYYWGHDHHALAWFTRQSGSLQMAPDEGLVGQVWSSGQPAWIEDMHSDPGWQCRAGARECGLASAYAFPVSYVDDGNQRHCIGVLEFYSTSVRQQDAQLPNLSAVLGALIAQTVRRMAQQEAMRRLAQTDDLTGLSNRGHFHHVLETTCSEYAQSRKQFGVLYIDLDGFKPVNDAFGHEAGNCLLREFAQRLQKLVPEGSEVGRLGGDEFAILTPVPDGSSATGHLQALAECTLQVARLPFRFEGSELKVSASVGISIFAENGDTLQELLCSADAAMYRCKKNGRNAFSFVSGNSTQLLAQQSSLAMQLTMEMKLHRAVADNAFFIEYQPIFDHDEERMVAVEALLRWRQPDGDLVRPDIFIPLAEKSHLIAQIGRWVVKQACDDLALLHRAGLHGLKVNVNMAASEFASPRLPYELLDAVAASGIQARHLCLELTEGMVMQQPEKVLPVMHMLRQLGFQISLDDFGMGYSSLSRLKRLPITSLKIDRSFVAGLPHDQGDSAIVRTIIELGKHMKLAVVAEGIETDAQLLYMAQFGCTLMQGYLLSRPLPIQELIDLYGH